MEVTKQEVRDAIKKVDDKESFEPDYIGYGCLKKLIDYISRPLTEIINMSIQNCQVPKMRDNCRD